MKELDDKKLVVIGSSTITVAGSGYKAAGLTIQFTGDSVIVDGKLSSRFTSWPTATGWKEDQIKKGQPSGTPDVLASSPKPTSSLTSFTEQGAINPTSETKKKSLAPRSSQSLSFLVFSLIMILGNL